MTWSLFVILKKSRFFIVYFVQIFGVGQNINAGCGVIKQKTARGNFYVQNRRDAYTPCLHGDDGE